MSECLVVAADCVKIMKEMVGKYDLVFADPPLISTINMINTMIVLSMMNTWSGRGSGLVP